VGGRTYVLTCLLAYLLTCLLAYLLTCLLAYLPTCLLAYLLTCLRAYLLTYAQQIWEGIISGHWYRLQRLLSGSSASKNEQLDWQPYEDHPLPSVWMM